MAPSLTSHDLSILEKIKDPESGPSAPLLINAELPRDPHLSDPSVYQRVTAKERDIITSIQAAELQLAGLKSALPESPLEQYQRSLSNLNDLVEEYPNYASARNNRAQALRRIYGDGLLVRNEMATSPGETSQILDPDTADETLSSVATMILDDLTTSVSLLTPTNPFSPISPTAAKTLSQSYTQRGAIYHLTAKSLAVEGAELRLEDGRRERSWTVVDFEENASADFMLGGRYGNEIAKALAVSTNPTAKLCGDMVKEAMRKEYAGGGVV
jgi:hypothetical protein